MILGIPFLRRHLLGTVSRRTVVAQLMLRQPIVTRMR